MTLEYMEADEEELPATANYYQNGKDVPKEIKKYWKQRHDIFSRYNDGIWMTDVGWYGVTPECVADKLSDYLAEAAPPHKTTVIDTFAGSGGNTIAFARSPRWKKVISIEKDADTLACAKHNAKIYGVDHKIEWHEGDSMMLLPKIMKIAGDEALIFGSPPWGGPTYRDASVFDVETMEPYTLSDLMAAYRIFTHDIALYLPRTSDLNQIAKFREPGHKVPVVHLCMYGFSKALCAFFGDLGRPASG